MYAGRLTDRLFVRLDEDAVHGPEATAPPGTLDAAEVPRRLQPFVSHLLLYRERIPDGCEIVERVVPDGALRFVCDFGDPAANGSGRTPPLQVIGPSASPALVRLRGHLNGLSLTLRPGAALSLLGVPAGELADAVVPLESLLRPGHYRRLVHELSGQATDGARVGAVERGLLRGIRERRASSAAIEAWRRLAAAAGRVTVREIARDAGVSERRLQQLFRDEVGLSPRTCLRVARLHGCIRRLRGDPQPWADVAADCGFYDQPHMIREFQALCGCTPAEFVRGGISRSSNTAV
jgi:AraC-like DNA-binding protein